MPWVWKQLLRLQRPGRQRFVQCGDCRHRFVQCGYPTKMPMLMLLHCKQVALLIVSLGRRGGFTPCVS